MSTASSAANPHNCMPRGQASVLAAQHRLASAVSTYTTILELDLARQNVLEVLRVAPATDHASLQMMLSALRSRRAQIESSTTFGPSTSVPADPAQSPLLAGGPISSR